MTNKTRFSKLLVRCCGKFAAPIIFCFLFVIGSYAQNPVSWSLNTAKPVKAGEKLNVQLSARISNGWYLYSLTQPSGGPNPTRITVASEQAFKLAGAIKAPLPKIKFDENFGINTESYAGNVTFTIPLQVFAEVQTGKQVLAFNVRFQVCNETTCLPPRTVKMEAPVDVTSGLTTSVSTKANDSPAVMPQSVGPTPTPMPKSTPQATPTPFVNSISKVLQSENNGIISENNGKEKHEERQSLLKDEGKSESNQSQFLNKSFDDNQSFFSFIWLAMTVGALSLLTPCVFPMIRITVSYFTNHSAGHRLKSVKLASVYSLGIITTFTLLGMLLAVFIGASGINPFAANPYVNLLIAGIFLFFAFNLFGAYEINIPTNVLTKLDNLTRSKEGGSIVGALLMGLTFTLTSFTCTSPFVGTILVSASQGSWQMPLLGMLAFSTVFALPFFVLALVPQWVSQLPRAGGWMNSVKVAMGFLEIAAAMKFISNVDLIWKWEVFTRPVILAIWISIGIILAIYLLGNFSFFMTQNRKNRCGTACFSNL